MSRWCVIGAGPCGIGSVSRLVDLKQQVTWIDAENFQVGRMGKYYRNVPANTPNGELKKAMKLSPSLKFDDSQLERKKKFQIVMSALSDEECVPLDTFVDALGDATEELRKQTVSLGGEVTRLEKSDEKDGKSVWKIRLKTTNDNNFEVLEADNIILATGSEPLLHRTELLQGQVKNHSMDLMVDPNYVKKMFASDENLRGSKWCVVGGSHSALLIIMNLVDNKADIVNIYKSDFRFQHVTVGGWKKYQGIGLKGPVGKWTKDQFAQTNVKRIKFDENVSWNEMFLKYGITDAVFAMGFSRTYPTIIVNGKEINNSDLDGYDKFTGLVPGTGSLFGAGIAFPQHYIDGGGDSEPWIGFKRSIEQVDLMIQTINNEKIIIKPST